MSPQSTESGVAGPDKALAHKYRSMPPNEIKTVLKSHKENRSQVFWRVCGNLPKTDLGRKLQSKFKM